MIPPVWTAYRHTFIGIFLTLSFGLASAAPANAAGFKFKKIVDTHTLIPDGTSNFTFNSSDVPAVSGDWVVFDTGDMTIWRSTTAGKKLKPLISQTTRIPGGWGKFRQFFGNYIQIHGETLVIVADNCGGCGSGVGIFTRSINGGPIMKLVDRNDTNPNFPGDDKNFGGFSPDFRTGDGLVVFSNRQNVFAVPLAGGPVTAIAGPQDQGNNPPGPYCCLFDLPITKDGKVFLRGGNVFGRGGLFTVDTDGNPLSFAVGAVHGMHPPKTPQDNGFNNFEFWGPAIDQTLVFGGASATDSNDIGPYIRGIYSRDGNDLTRLADSNQIVPGGTGAFDFGLGGGRTPILASNGMVVFASRDAVTGMIGLYAVRQTGGRIKKIIAQGDPIGGFIVESLNIGLQALSGNTLVFSVGYANFQGFGMYSTEVVFPE